MEFVRDRKAQKITINGKTYTASQAVAAAGADKSELLALMEQQYGAESFFVDLAKFLGEWFDDSDVLQVQTSGSTGTPKKLLVEKERMMNSAAMTLSFLELHPGDSALLCMPLAYIAGKMVVVRSLVGSLNLCVTEPSSNPMQSWREQCKQDGIDECNIISPSFAAMIPMQVYNCVRDPLSDAMLRNVRQLIIGGGAVDADLASRLADYPNKVWSTYGMTETLSHIALRRINSKSTTATAQASANAAASTSAADSAAADASSLKNSSCSTSDYVDDGSSWYEPFEGVQLSVSDRGGLVINAQAVCAETLTTNDVVVFNELGHFKVIGRLDNVINSGGVKVQIETVERQIAANIESQASQSQAKHSESNKSQVSTASSSDNDFAVNSRDASEEASMWSQLQCMITSKPHDKFGQIVVLLYSFKDGKRRELAEAQWDKVFANLQRYHIPKLKLYVEALPLTGTGKPDRATAKSIAAKA